MLMPAYWTLAAAEPAAAAMAKMEAFMMLMVKSVKRVARLKQNERSLDKQEKRKLGWPRDRRGHEVKLILTLQSPKPDSG